MSSGQLYRGTRNRACPPSLKASACTYPGVPSVAAADKMESSEGSRPTARPATRRSRPGSVALWWTELPVGPLQPLRPAPLRLRSAGRPWVRTHHTLRCTDSACRRPVGSQRATNRIGNDTWAIQPASVIEDSARPTGGRTRPATSPKTPAARNAPPGRSVFYLCCSENTPARRNLFLSRQQPFHKGAPVR